MKKNRTNADGFEAVLAFFTAQSEQQIADAEARPAGRPSNGKTLMANALGTSRQVIDNWQSRGRGIPNKYSYIMKIGELTGMKPEDILPENFK